jgi:chorismate mutase
MTQLSKLGLVVFTASTIGITGMLASQSTADPFRSLVATSAERLLIAREVALAKWDSGTAVEDAPREAEVIAEAVREGDAKGLDQTIVSKFFRAQIEANKVVQYSLLADWRRAGTAPPHSPVNLASAIRPKLDQIQRRLIGQLAQTAENSADAACRTNLAKAIGEYVTSHRDYDQRLLTIALDRALSSTCVPLSGVP